eukprot:7379985-Prymnesium_polylepis.1
MAQDSLRKQESCPSLRNQDSCLSLRNQDSARFSENNLPPPNNALHFYMRPATPVHVHAAMWEAVDEVAELKKVVEMGLHDWTTSILEIDQSSGNHALLAVAPAIFEKHGILDEFSIGKDVFRAFLAEIELYYGSNPYHGPVHAADVLLSQHLSKAQLLAVFLGAIIHDFNHPGTTNAHEVKTQSLRAILYSDKSVLEQHHLATSFMLLTESRFSVLRGLSAAEYGEVRGMIIDTVLYTDLSKHFDFTAKVRSITMSRTHFRLKPCKLARVDVVSSCA